MKRRLVRVLISPEFFPSLFETGSFWSVVDGLPEGANLIRPTYDFLSDVYSIIFEHESFEEIAEGAAIPVKDIIFSKAG